MEQSKILDARVAQRIAVKKLNKEVTDEFATADVADIRATIKLLAEGLRPGLSPSSMPDTSKWQSLVPEEFRPDPT